MTLKGRIIKGIGGFYYVDAAGVVYETRARGVFRVQGRKPLVGDIVQIELINEEEKTAFSPFPRLYLIYFLQLF